VRRDLELAVARRIAAQLVERQPRQPRPDLGEEGVERRRRCERCEALPRERAERNARQVIGRRRERAGTVEARHERHAPGEVEAPRVVAAADLLGVAGRMDEHVAAVRADIGETSQLSRCVASEQERLDEVPGQQLARRERSRDRDIVEVAEPLPGPREHPLARQRVDGGIEIERARQRSRLRDVGVDREGERHGFWSSTRIPAAFSASAIYVLRRRQPSSARPTPKRAMVSGSGTAAIAPNRPAVSPLMPSRK